MFAAPFLVNGTPSGKRTNAEKRTVKKCARLNVAKIYMSYFSALISVGLIIAENGLPYVGCTKTHI